MTESDPSPDRRDPDHRNEDHRSPGPSAEGRHPDEFAPLAVSTAWVVVGGITAWALALVVTLLVPALHEGERNWWPWTCVAGIVLGGLGYTYVRRGRGNAAGAE